MGLVVGFEDKDVHCKGSVFRHTKTLALVTCYFAYLAIYST